LRAQAFQKLFDVLALYACKSFENPLRTNTITTKLPGEHPQYKNTGEDK